MITTIISTVGTSLFGNLTKLEENHSLRQHFEAKNWTLLAKELAKLDPEERNCGAEINSLAQLMRKRDFQQVSRLFFCVSDTDDGEAIGTVLKSYYSEINNKLDVQIHPIIDLSGENPERFKVYGLRNLARIVGDIVQKAGDSRYVALNCTGGYKAQVAIAVLMGQALNVDVYYKHETFPEIISFPGMPVSFDYSVLASNGDLLAALESGDVFEAPETEVESIRSLLEEVEVDGKKLWELAPIGQIFLEGFRKQFPPEKTLPRPVVDSERKAPTFGDDHHYPAGFKDYVNRVWRETPYAISCNSESYSGQRAIRDKRFRVASDGKIIGEYRSGGFGARFEIRAHAESPLQRTAVILDLAQRFGK